MQYNHRLPLKSTYVLLSRMTLFSTRNNQHTTTSRKLWTQQLDISENYLLQTRLQYNYDPTRQLKEKHNRFLRYISQT